MNAAILWFALATAAILVILTWVAARAWYRTLRSADTQVLDAVWQMCDLAGWPGELGERLRYVLELEPNDPIPDAADLAPDRWAPLPRDFVILNDGPRIHIILPAVDPEGTAA